MCCSCLTLVVNSIVCLCISHWGLTWSCHTGKEPWTQYNDVTGHVDSASSETSTPLELLPPRSSNSPDTTYKTSEPGAYLMVYAYCLGGAY